jgi:hypothetical protein
MKDNDVGQSVKSYPRYRIFSDGRIVDLSVDRAINHTIESKSGIVIVNVQNSSWKWTKVSVARLVLMAYRPCDELWWYGYATVHYINGDKTDVCLNNLEWRFQNYKPHLIPGLNINLDTYVKIPGFHNYEINGCGQHRNAKTGALLSDGYLSDSGYLKVRVIDDKGISRNVGIHRLLALTFLEHPVDTSDLLVNHKDGNKLNLDISNLEWATYLENNIHAWETGLQTGRNGPVLVMDRKTRIVTKFTNMSKLLRELNLPGTSVHRWLDEKDENLRPHQGFFIKYESDNREWPPETQTDFRKERREGTDVSLKNMITGDLENHKSVSSVARKFGVDKGNIQRLLDCSDVMPYNDWLLRCTCDEPWPVYTQEQLDQLRLKLIPGKRIVVTNPDVAESKTYTSIEAFSKESGVSKYHIRNALAGNNRTKYNISQLHE